jgi:hypothetical protein
MAEIRERLSPQYYRQSRDPTEMSFGSVRARRHDRCTHLPVPVSSKFTTTLSVTG